MTAVALVAAVLLLLLALTFAAGLYVLARDLKDTATQLRRSVTGIGQTTYQLDAALRSVPTAAPTRNGGV